MLGTTLRQFAVDESGATAIEYGVLVACLSAALIAAFTLLGDNLGNLFGDTESGVSAVLIEATESMSD